MPKSIGRALYEEAILQSEYGRFCQDVFHLRHYHRPRIDNGEWVIDAQQFVDDYRKLKQMVLGHTLPAITVNIRPDGYELVVEFPFTPQPCEWRDP